MGGEGSTRWAEWSKALTVEQCLALDTRRFRQNGDFARSFSDGKITWNPDSGAPILTASYAIDGAESGTATVRLQYGGKSCGTPGLMTEAITTVATHPNFGGRRWWFKCGGCGRRARKLFLVTYRGGFRCRQCHRLTYRSCQESHSMDGFAQRLLRCCLSLRSGDDAD